MLPPAVCACLHGVEITASDATIGHVQGAMNSRKSIISLRMYHKGLSVTAMTLSKDNSIVSPRDRESTATADQWLVGHIGLFRHP